MMNPAPIILFVFNRLWHTQQTIKALQQNTLAKISDLIIYSDGAEIVTSSNELSKIQEVRKYIGTISGFKTVKVIERKENYGLAKSLLSGITEVLKYREKAIILEDDIVTSPIFLNYMNEALNYYENNNKVMHISGYMFPVKKKLPETFFLNTATCWGWGTWARAWNHLILDSSFIIKEIYRKDIVNRINLDKAYNHFDQLLANHEGTKKTWAIFWHSSIILNGGYCLHPYPSLVNNIGNDNSGVNSVADDMFNWDTLAREVIVKKIELKESKKAKKALKDFYQKGQRLSLRSRIKQVAGDIFSEKVIIKMKTLTSQKARYEQGLMNYLSKYPRYLQGEVDLFLKRTRFVDAKSFIFMFKEIFNEEVYKYKTEKYNPTILDCGANIGLSIIFFKRLYPHAKIIAFEPDEDIFSVLRFNISESHQLSDVQLINAALWVHENGISFRSEGADAGKICHGESQNIVSTCRLSSYLDEEIDFLKIDIEGAEYEVLNECGDKLKNVKNIFIEYHSFEDKPQQLSYILDILIKRNFRYYITIPGLKSKNPLIKLNKYAGMDMQLNIYAINLS